MIFFLSACWESKPNSISKCECPSSAPSFKKFTFPKGFGDFVQTRNIFNLGPNLIFHLSQELLQNLLLKTFHDAERDFFFITAPPLNNSILSRNLRKDPKLPKEEL